MVLPVRHPNTRALAQGIANLNQHLVKRGTAHTKVRMAYEGEKTIIAQAP